MFGRFPPFFNKNTTKRLYSIQRNYKEIRIPVPWGYIAGKWWYPTDQRPILTLHGWQDNCGSFDRLIPLLNDEIAILAIDLPGHGLSTKLPPGMFYTKLHYPMLIRRIKRYFQWDQVTLMGHSLGAMSSYTYTMLYPDNVDFLICLDALTQLYIKDNIKILPNSIDNHLKYDKLLKSTDEPPSYTIEEMKQMISKMFSASVDIEYSHYLLYRNIEKSKQNPDKYYFTRDPRLKDVPTFNWSQSDLIEAADRIKTPILLLKFIKTGYLGNKERVYQILDALNKTSKYCQVHYIDGKHHHHLNHPESIKELINDFINKHNVSNSRKIYELRPEFIV